LNTGTTISTTVIKLSGEHLLPFGPHRLAYATVDAAPPTVVEDGNPDGARDPGRAPCAGSRPNTGETERQ
jgi:hypothetical protein